MSGRSLVKEARERFSAVQSSVAKLGHHSPTHPGSIPTNLDSNTQAIATLQEQIKALKLEMKTMKKVSIPTIQSETKSIAKDRATVGSFGKKLDLIASSQANVASPQTDRFDKIDLLLNKLKLVLTPSHLNHLQTYLNSTGPQLSPIPASSHMDAQWEDCNALIYYLPLILLCSQIHGRLRPIGIFRSMDTFNPWTSSDPYLRCFLD